MSRIYDWDTDEDLNEDASSLADRVILVFVCAGAAVLGYVLLFLG